MIDFIKKNKKIILSSSIFSGINNILYCKCGSCSKDDKNKNIGINNADNDKKVTDTKPQEGDRKPQEDDIKDLLKDRKDYLKDLLKKVNENNNKLSDDKEQIKITDEIINSKTKKEELDTIENDLNIYSSNIINKISSKDAEQGKNLKREECLNLLEVCENLNKQLSDSDKIDLGITKETINNENNVVNIDNFKKNLNDKKSEIEKKIIEENYICQTQEDFIIKFNEEKNALAELFSDNIKKKLEDNDLKAEDLKEDDDDNYYKMYRKMTSDIFNHRIALHLQISRYILKLEGFITALDNIFEKKIQYWFLMYFQNIDDKIVNNRSYHVYKKNNRENYAIQKLKVTIKNYNNLEITSGDFFVENEKFKYVRCNNGCKNDQDCISCKLRKLLSDENILTDFLKIYKDQGAGSSKPEAMKIKYYLFQNLKKDKKKKDAYFSICSLNEKDFDEFQNNLNKENIKCILIEWALTIEFMKRFIPKIITGDFYLYRTFSPTLSNNFIDLNTIKNDLYESTSLIAPSFIPDTLNGDINKYKLCSFTQTVEPVELYRCLFNHIISPTEKTILLNDYEHEIGFIGIDKKYKRISDKTGDEYFKEYHHFLKTNIETYTKKNLKEAEKINFGDLE